MPVIQPTHSTFLQLVWIELCKLVKINSRLGTLNQEVIQIAQWCPTTFYFLFSLLESFKSLEALSVKAFTHSSLPDRHSLFCQNMQGEDYYLSGFLQVAGLILMPLINFQGWYFLWVWVVRVYGRLFALNSASLEAWPVPANMQKTSGPWWHLLNK